MEFVAKKLSNKKLSFLWKDPMHTTEVEVTLPDLTKIPYSVCGDWGPMYCFEIGEQPVKLRFNGKESKCEQQRLRVNSTMDPIERKTLPFYLYIEDSQRQIKFVLHLDSSNELAKVEVVRLTDDAPLFREKYASETYDKVI